VFEPYLDRERGERPGRLRGRRSYGASRGTRARQTLPGYDWVEVRQLRRRLAGSVPYAESVG